MKKDISKAKVGRRFIMTQVFDANKPYNHHPRAIIREGKVYDIREVEINWIEDRGEYLYIGYTSKEPGCSSFGAAKVYKKDNPYEYGTLGFEAKYPYNETEDGRNDHGNKSDT